jgi:hypothetical protein
VGTHGRLLLPPHRRIPPGTELVAGCRVNSCIVSCSSNPAGHGGIPVHAPPALHCLLQNTFQTGQACAVPDALTCHHVCSAHTVLAQFHIYVVLSG